MRLRRLKINRFHHVKPGCELIFHEGTNVVLGKNGTGKTALLNLISMVLRFDFSSAGKEELDIEFDLTLPIQGSPSSLRAAIAFTRAPSEAPELGSGSKDRLPPFLPNIFFQLTLGKELVVYRLNRNVLRIERSGRMMVERPLFYGVHTDAPFLLLYTIMETSRGLASITDIDQVVSSFQSILYRFSRTHRLDEALDLFAGVVGVRGNQLSASSLPAEALVRVMPGAAPAAPSPVSLRNHEVLRKHPSMVFSFVPLDLWRAAWKHSAADRQLETLCITDAELPWLRKVALLLGLVSAEVHLSRLEHKGEGESEEITFGKLAFVFTRQGDLSTGRGQLTHAQLSYGQKRLLSLFYYLAANPEHIVADELMSGLDPAWAAAVMEEVGQRQAFLASHSLLLLDSQGVALPADRAHILCELDQEQDAQMIWRNTNAEEAELLDPATTLVLVN